MPIFISILKRTQKLILVGISLAMPYEALTSQLFRYQDDQGRWHFTDKPPAGQTVTDISSKKKEISNTNQTSQNSFDSDTKNANFNSDLNLAARLQHAIQPKNKIETASMAVVGIKTHFGSGSGFFMSDQGHIVTNRHVIRAKEHFKEAQEEFAKSEKRLQKWKKRLSNRKQEIKDYEYDLKKYAQDSGLNYSKPQDSNLKDRKERLRDAQHDYKAEIKSYETQYSAWDKAHSDFKWRNSMASMAKTFTITLKTGRQLKAHLVYISKKYDLALLQLQQFQTPFLQPGTLSAMAQGDQVYAIGSPLGQQDSVSAGILTSKNHSKVVTDSQILPGNSGGPLIDAEGQVIAVNTARISEVRGGAGFGHSIPIDIVTEELGAYMK